MDVDLDFQKAFDKVPDKRLVNKTKPGGIGRSVLGRNEDCLSYRSSELKYVFFRLEFELVECTVIVFILQIFIFNINDLEQAECSYPRLLIT